MEFQFNKFIIADDYSPSLDINENALLGSKRTNDCSRAGANKRILVAVEDYSTTQKTDAIVELVVGKGELEKTIQVASPSKALEPTRCTVIDPKTHRANCYIQVERRKNNSAHITLPESWQLPVGTPVCYEFIDEDGLVYNGRTENVVQRLKKDYPSYFNGNTEASNRSLAKAWKSGKQLFMGIKYICSSLASSKQNETSFIVAGETLVKKKKGHNGNCGEGDPNVIFGSPIRNGEGYVPEHLIYKPSQDFTKMPVISDPGSYTPDYNASLEYDSENESYSLDFPQEWKQIEDAVYRWKVTFNKPEKENENVINQEVSEDSEKPALKLYGHSIHPTNRFENYISDFNGKGKCSHLPLPKQVQASKGLKNMKVEVGIVGCVPPNGPDRPVKALRQAEGFFINIHNTTNPKKGFNQRREGGSLKKLPFQLHNPNSNRQS